MKYPLPLVLVACGAVAVAYRAMDDGSGLWPSASSAPASTTLNVNPPWLTDAWEDNSDALMRTSSSPHAGADPHGGIYGAGPPHAGAEPHGGVHAADPHARLGVTTPGVAVPPAVARSSAANGRTVAEIFAQRAALREQHVTVRGTIVKRMDGILGKTYLHLRDGSGSPKQGDHDLTLTTHDAFELGELVEVEGQVLVDHDVGLGYQYPALLASVTRASP